MKWSIKLGRFLGIDVYLHVTFFLLLAVLGVVHWLAQGSIAAVLIGVGFIVALFACVLLHEYGHALAARRFSIETRDITLLPIGGLARLERMPDKPIQELWVALAGPAVNVLIAGVLAAWLTLTNAWQPLGAISMTSGSFLERLVLVNVALVVFNMIPAFPMDGGRVLRALLAMRLEYAQATRIAATVGQALAIAFGFVGLFANPFLVLIAIFIWIGASQEAAATDMKAAIGDLPVCEAMLTDFRTLSTEDPLHTATRLLLEGSQQDFPVLDADGRVVGVLPRTRLFEFLREKGEWSRVDEAMLRDFHPLHPEQRLDAVFAKNGFGNTVAPVIEHGRLIGLLTAENIGELLMIRTASKHTSGTPPPLPPKRVTAG